MNKRFFCNHLGTAELALFLTAFSLACLAATTMLGAQPLDANQRNADREFAAGEALVRSGQVTQAAERFELALKEENKSARPRLEKQGLFAHMAGYHFFEALYVDKAEELMKQAIALREKLQQNKLLDLAQSLSCLGMINEALGRLEKAIPLYARALELRANFLKPDDPALLLSKTDLAWVCGSNGQLERMSKLSKEVSSALKGDKGGDYLQTLNTGNNEPPTKKEYIDMINSAMKEFSSDSIAKMIMDSIASDGEMVNDSLKQFLSEAVLHLSKSQLEDMISEKIRDSSVADTAKLKVTDFLSDSDQKNFEYYTAWTLLPLWIEQHLKQGLDDLGQPPLWQRRLRPSSYNTGQFMTNIFTKGSTQSHRLGQSTDDDSGNYLIDNPFKLASQFDQRPENYKTQTDSSIFRRHEVAGRYEKFLSQKRLLLNIDIRQHEYLRTTPDDEIRSLRDHIIQGLNKQMWYRLQSNEFWKNKTAYTEILEFSHSFEKKLSTLATLSASAAGQQYSLGVVTVETIARAVPPKTTLIEFFKFEVTPVERSTSLLNNSSENPQLQTHYGVFILPAQNPRALEMIDLGSAAIIDSLLSQCRIQLQEVVNFDVDLFKEQISISEKAFIGTSKELYNKIFKPFSARLPGSGAIYIAPDSDLHLLPFSMLVDEENKYLVDRYEFIVVDSGKDFLSRNQKRSNNANAGDFVVFADADYDAVWDSSIKRTKPVNSNSGKPKSPGVTPAQFQQAFKFPEYPRNFKRLAGTKKEIDDIRQRFAPQNEKLYTRMQASEANLYRIRRPWRLHIATHGFFISDLVRGYMQEQDTPYFQAGLALTYANNHKTFADYERGTENDGIITAYEIFANMDLTGTDLVVLSACETGLGTVTQGEGVYGLRRAFQMVGAHSVVMSLWSVRDETTAALIASFYGNLAQGMNKSKALHDAMRKVKNEVNSHPYFWAPFVYAENLN